MRAAYKRSFLNFSSNLKTNFQRRIRKKGNELTEEAKDIFSDLKTNFLHLQQTIDDRSLALKLNLRDVLRMTQSAGL